MAATPESGLLLIADLTGYTAYLTGSEHRPANARSKVGAATTAQLVWILAPRLPEPGGRTQTDD